jgi:hypothetical protein
VNLKRPFLEATFEPDISCMKLPRSNFSEWMIAYPHVSSCFEPHVCCVDPPLQLLFVVPKPFLSVLLRIFSWMRFWLVLTCTTLCFYCRSIDWLRYVNAFLLIPMLTPIHI